MSKVYLSQSFSQIVEVPEGLSMQEAIQRATDTVDWTICHQCNERLEMDGEARALYVDGVDVPKELQ